DKLRSYIERQDQLLEDEFRRRTGMEPVGEDQYVAYLLSIDRPEFAPAIDLPTRDWLREIAENIEPMPASERADFEKRLDAWSDYLMGIYEDLFTTYQANLGEALPSLANSASVQIDHAAVRNGQYHPRAYRPLDFRYQTAWNDQVGGPDYSYQWLFVAGVLEMGGEKKPTWISNAMAAAHGRSSLPGKLARVAAHILPYDGTGIGFALEGFSNILGGMNKKTNWQNIRDTPAAEDVLAGADFMNRFAPLGIAGSTDFGTGILYSRHQMGRENLGQGYGTRHYDAFVALTRLGHTPRLLTEERILRGALDSVESLVIPMQTVPLPDEVTAAIERFVAGGGRVLADASTTIDLPEGIERLDYDFTREGRLGKPHSWNAPNVTAGMNDTLLLAERLPELMHALHKGLEGRGQGVLRSTAGPDAKASLLQISGGEDATYVIAVNDSFIRTQADWHQVTETLEPTPAAPSAALLYDVTEQEALGPLQPFACDLTATTARLFAVLKRPIGPLEVAATQQLAAGEPVTLRVSAVDEEGEPLRAAIPVQILLTSPSGEELFNLYRSTDQDGELGISLPLGVNTVAGEWTVSVRSQLDGRVVALPIRVQPNGAPDAEPIRGPLVVRERDAIVNGLSSGTEWVIPVFDSAEHDQQLELAQTLSKTLSEKGVKVEIMDRPTLETYYLAYEATDEQAAANQRVESGQAIGKIERLTINLNDWFSGASGYRFAKPVILLDVVGVKDNPMAESLDRLGALWPEVSEAFPGRDRGLAQLVHWAFSPRTPAVVLQADSIDGLRAAATGLTGELPEDKLATSVARARASIWEQFHIDGEPGRPEAGALAGLTSNGVQVRRDADPFRLALGEQRPLEASEVTRPEPPKPEHVSIPATFEPADVMTLLRKPEGGFVEATRPTKDWARDLRFSEAVAVFVETDQPQTVEVEMQGVLRYSDRRPRSQAQWERILALRDRVVEPERKPMRVTVIVDGEAVGTLEPTQTQEREVPIDTVAGFAQGEPTLVKEEVVTRVSGELKLPEGEVELILVPEHVVDGVLETVTVTPVGD
ncbi:MAG: hypothetical protein ACOC1G_07490, partial [Phycisphaeraceae bacterium]